MKNYKYRTPEQYSEIVENCLNGNWRYAAQNCVDYGFYANDLIHQHKENKEMEEFTFKDECDMVELIEIATEIRYK